MTDRLEKPTKVAVRKAVHSAKFSLVQVGELLKLAIPALTIAALALLAAFQFIDPPPPKRITLATGGETGAYYKFGGRYAEILKRSGIQVTVKPTGGSVENLALLRDGRSGVDAAFVQGGLAGPEAKQLGDLSSAGRLFYEPLWVFIAADRGSTGSRMPRTSRSPSGRKAAARDRWRSRSCLQTESASMPRSICRSRATMPRRPSRRATSTRPCMSRLPRRRSFNGC